MDELLEGLTPEQRTAVQTADRDLQVIACAGAGKTRVMVLRILNLIRGGADPESIVAITFTRKAAAEMKQRIYADGARLLGSVQGFAGMFIGTIDAFCMQMLQDGVEDFAKFTVLDNVQTRVFIDRYRRECGLEASPIPRARNLLQDRAGQARIYADLMSRMNSQYYDREKRARWSEDLQAGLRAYQTALYGHSFFDFSSLLREMIERLDPDSDTNGGRLSPFGEKLLRRVRYLTVDEYQDVNPAQEYLVRLFKDHGGANLCVVGDADQTIYQFRGSENQSLRRFRERFRPLCVRLDRCFRSTEAVTDIAAQAFRGAPEDPDRRPMEAAGDRSWEPGDTVWKHCGGFGEECVFIRDRIAALRALGVPYSEMAVLLRQRGVGWQQTRVDFPKELVRVLKAAGIPCAVADVKTLFETRECAAAVGIFKYLYDKYLRGVKQRDGSFRYGYVSDPEHLAENEARAQRALTALWREVEYPLPAEALDRAVSALVRREVPDGWNASGAETNLQQIYQDFLGFLPILNAGADPAAERILYNLGAFSRVIRDFESVYFTEKPILKLRRFYQHLTDFAPGVYGEGEQENPYIRSDAVRIMTVHQSKGLEFTAVFLPALRMNIFPNSGIRRRTPGEIRSSADLLPEEAPAAPKQGGFPEEERNIFYVALTRSKKFLFLTDSDRYGGKSYAPSPLLALARESAQLRPFQDLPYPGRQLPVMHREPDPITLNFTLLSDYFDCPYRFKLSAFYGFTPPIRPQQGYGAMLHEVMMHLHRLWLAGERPGPDQVREIVRRSLFLPYADQTILARAGKSAEANALAYWRQNGQDAGRIRHAELDIDLQLGEGVNVNGRIDLIRTYETEGGERLAIIDLKSAGKDAEECLNADQLKIYALGYQERTGEMADKLMIYNLDVPDGSANTQEPVDPDLLERTKERIRAAVRHIRAGDLPRKPGAVCETCRLRNLCRRREA